MSLYLTPRASHTRFDGVRRRAQERDILCVRVAAVPVEGAANAALIAFLAKHWNVPCSAIALIKGQSARIKRLTITAAPEKLAAIEADLTNMRDSP